jgi:mono/diheme cytochrome c family protein
LNALVSQLGLGCVLLALACGLGLVALRERVRSGSDASTAFGRSRAFAALALISGLVFVISGIVNASAPPITYLNPTADSVASVDRGAVVYDATCARCHGAEYRGDGPDAGTTAVPPGSLVTGHLDSHSDSDLYTWIRDGLPGGMPGYATTLTEAQRWDLVNFLRGINGQGPSPDVTPAPAPSPSVNVASELAGFGAVGGASLVLLGWFTAGVRRSRSTPAARPGSSAR